MERAFPRSIFITFNGSHVRSLFPDTLPIFYMFSLRHGISDKPWFLPRRLTRTAIQQLNGQSSELFRPASNRGRVGVMTDYNVLAAGDTALVVDFGDTVDLNVSAKVLALAGRLNDLKIDGVIETVPTIRSLSIYYEPLTVSATRLERQVADILEHLDEAPATGRTCDIPVCYDPELAPDLELVASRCNLGPDSGDRNSQQPYLPCLHARVSSRPGLSGRPAAGSCRLSPRMPTPRPKVPAGSLGIGGTLTCIYPMATPCGWHIIGRSPISLWDSTLTGGALLRAGDKVKFEPCEFARVPTRVRNVAAARPDTSH